MFVNLWKRAPFLRLIIPLITGMIIGLLTKPSFIPLLLGCFLTGCFFPLPVKWRFALRHIRGACLLLSIACFGILLMQHTDARKHKDWVGHHARDTCRLVVVLQEPPLKKTNSYKAEAEVTAVINNGRMKPVHGRIFLYFREEPPLQYSDKLLIHTTLRPIRGMGNPGEFDYGKYCSYRNIFHQAYLRRSQWQQLPGAEKNRLNDWLFRSREYCLQTLKTYIPHREEYGIAQALLIGYREELDKEIVQAYTNTGVVHIIAISGLHLGLIYVTLLQLLQWLPKKKWMDVCKALLLILVLWAFSLLTGASASVLRSAVMFTTIAVGQFVIARHTNIYNTLAAAAFFLLCYNPYFLLDAGFQLSFLAVAGILLCYKPVYGWWMIKNKWLDKLWQMVAVSLAAQVFTWPVCLYYFHQFPNLFLLANIIAVPLSTILLYGEILLMCFAGVPLIAGWLGKLLEWGIAAMNTLIQWIDRIPGAVTDGINVDLVQTFCLYGITIAICAWFLAKWKAGCYWMLGIGAVFAGWLASVRISAKQQQRIIVYNTPRLTAIECIRGQKSILYADSIHLLQRYVDPARAFYRIKQTADSSAFNVYRFHPPPDQRGNSSYNRPAPDQRATFSYNHPGELIRFGGKTLLRLTQALPKKSPLHRIRINYILLSHNSKVDISRLQDFFIYDLLVFDGSNAPFLIRKWKNACKELPLRCFSVPDEGALVVNL